MINKKEIRSAVKPGSILKEVDRMKKAIEAFDNEVNNVPEPQDHCVHCIECRKRAKKLSVDFKNFFQVFLTMKRKKV